MVTTIVITVTIIIVIIEMMINSVIIHYFQYRIPVPHFQYLNEYNCPDAALFITLYDHTIL